MYLLVNTYIYNHYTLIMENQISDAVDHVTMVYFYQCENEQDAIRQANSQALDIQLYVKTGRLRRRFAQYVSRIADFNHYPAWQSTLDVIFQ